MPITNAEKAAVEAQLGAPHTSIFVQYGDYLRNIATLRFGTSFSFPSQTVALTIGKALPWTVVLVGATTVFAFVIGTLLGVYAGWHRARFADSSVTILYAARNAVLPNVTAFGLMLGAVVGGSVLVEGVYSYPGIGNLLYLAVTNHDYPLMQALLLVFTLSMLVAIFVVDLIYPRLDPRVRSAT